MNALDKMKSPKLMKYIIDEVHNMKVIGEEDTISCLTLKVMLRLVQNAKATSSNVLVSDNTGGGKDWLTKHLLEVLCCNTDYEHFTGLSDKFLNYYQPQDPITHKPISWNGKVLYLEDPSEETIKSQTLKTMASGGNKVGTVSDQKSKVIDILGKPVIIVTSMKTSIDDEGQRRWDSLRVDLSKEVSSNVIDSVLDDAIGDSHTVQPDNAFRSLLQTLRPYTVIIPYALKLKSQFQNPDTVDRTQINKLIDYIKASAVLHQYQRQEDAEGRLIAEYEDYEFARFAYIHLKNAEGNALNKKEETLVEYLRKQGEPKKLSEIVTDLNAISKTWLYENKENLVDKKVVKAITKFDALLNKEVEHLTIYKDKATSTKKRQLKSAKHLFNASGYWANGDFYADINAERKANGLKTNFTEVVSGKPL